MFFLIFPMLVMFSICVFATNSLVEKEADFALNRGTYRIAAENAPAGNNPLIGSHSYTHSKRIVTDDVQYPTVRIEYYASASISSLNMWNDGTYYTNVEVPRKASTFKDYGYDGVFSFSDSREITRDIWMGGPDIGACNAKATMKDDSGISCAAEIPW